MEPQLPRRKKNPAYSYRTHSFLKSPSNGPLRHTSTSLDRARVINGEDKSNNRESKDDKRAISTEYRLQFAWPGNCKVDSGGVATTAKKSQSMGTIKALNNNNLVSNPDIHPTPVHKKENVDPKNPPVVSSVSNNPESLVNGDLFSMLKKEDQIKVEQLQKDEYIRPIYGWSELNSEYQKKFRPFSQYDYVEGVFKAKKEPELVPAFTPSETWFREVLELRKKAGEYKHRGWGTELVPDHIAELYNKQISLWEHVARRSSLEALSLASSAHKKADDNEALSGRKGQSRTLWVELEGGKNEANRARMENFLRYNFEKPASAPGRTQSNEQRTEYKSPKKSARLHSSQTKPASGSIDKTEKSQRPRCKGTSGTSGPDVFKNIVKSPPEPTRVKSPEQIILRSPEPVNWTVPLDTGKTFTVTQNVSEEILDSKSSGRMISHNSS